MSEKHKTGKAPLPPNKKYAIQPPSSEIVTLWNEIDDYLARNFAVWASFMPLKVGGTKEIKKAIDAGGFTEATPDDVHKIIERHLGHERYHQAILVGGVRYRLDGTADGEVTTGQQQFARSCLEANARKASRLEPPE